MTEPDWSSLRHELGPADDIPDLLDELVPDPRASVWGELWDRLYHQGSIYPASPHVLPYLLEAAQDWVPLGRVMPLALANAIVASRDFRTAGFAETVAGLKSIAMETLEAPGIPMADRVYLMSAALTFGGDLVWGPAIEHINDEEFCGTCPLCDAELFFAIQANGGFIRSDFNITRATRQDEITPRDEAALPNPGAWLNAVAVRAGDLDLANRIRCVFGTANCTACSESVDVAAAIEQFETSAS